MSSATVGTHSGAGPLSLMSCVRESSPLQDFESDTEKNVGSKRRFWNPRKWFRKRNKVSEDVVVVETSSSTEIIGRDALRSRSTSELSVAEETQRRSSGSMHPGLSVSHDSVFHSPNSGSDMELDAAQSSSSLSMSQPHIDLRLQSELNERLRLRRGRGDTSEDDEGLPRSPCNSPTTSDGLIVDKTGIKDLPVKSHSTCSDGSLLSMGSSEMDEDSIGPQSRHSSKLSLYDKKTTSDFEFGPSTSTAPLNHSAAHHRVAVKPKRTHGAPRRKRGQQLASALPVTPEVNEEPSIRSMSPETNIKETLTELYSMSSTSTTTLTETQLKCSSLPPGLTAPGAETTKLNRSKSNAGGKSQDNFVPLREDEKEEKLSIFERIFPRKSGRKKKNVDVKESCAVKEEEGAKFAAVSKPIPAPRAGAASRQRMQPCDIPVTPDEVRKDAGAVLPKSSPEKVAGTSPLQAELENRFKQRLFPLSTSPTSPGTPPRSPKAVESPISPTVISSKSEYLHFQKSSSTTTSYQTQVKKEDVRNKVKIAGLSSLQQRVLSLNNDEADNTFKSLTDFSRESDMAPVKTVTKSHSFKSVKKPSITPESNNNTKFVTEQFLNKEREQSRVSFTRATSLDSVSNLDSLEIKPTNKQNDTAKSEDSLTKLKSEELFRDSSITISGPSHTAIVNVSSSKEDFNTTSKNHTETVQADGTHKFSIKEHQVSVTKIHVKKELTEVTQSTVTLPKSDVPEFLNKQLNKVEIRPSSNVVFSMKSPKVCEETLTSAERPKTLFDFNLNDVTSKPPAPRKFSKENVEIIEKNDKDQEHVLPTVVSHNRFKKHEAKNTRKSSVVSITPESPIKDVKNVFKTRSTSLDSLRSDANETSDKSSQDSLDKLEEDKNVNVDTTVVLRRKSTVNKKNEEEPELMKVFARRSLKLKDSEVDAIQDCLVDMKTRDSDKENHQIESPVDDRKKFFNNEPPARRKSVNKEPSSPKKDDKEPLVENKLTESKINGKEINNGSPPALRRTFNSNVFSGQRTISLNPPKTASEFILKKQPSFQEQKKVEKWITNVRNEEEKLDDQIVDRSEFITEPKNFSQRKAEWEKRAQLAQRKTTP